jgi:hypothetical protein
MKLIYIFAKNKMKKIIKIRYNTAVDDDFLYWRVLEDGVEKLASDIQINVPSYTTNDMIEGVGMKHHITCESEDVVWDEENKIVTIN